MPEGHTIHRAARDQTRWIAGETLAISSPQGRFAEQAGQIDGCRLDTVEAYGKHLLYRFENAPTLHVHLGLFGRFTHHKVPAREPRGAVRVRFSGSRFILDLNGPNTCELLEPPQIAHLLGRIGPDPLRADADPERAYRRIAKSKAPIGLLIMDQAVMAGVGNIYRTEILWRQRLHPETPGAALSRQAFDALWADAKDLLALGVKTNMIVTVDLERGRAAKTKYRERTNIFAHECCPSCAGAIRRFEMAARRAFVCETCQPPV